MIFLSHNYQDKILVEQIAIRLREIFGQGNIFYDSWSIQPGDGIIDKMNEGLSNCRFFLFFVSKNSLQSNMVKLEWQNALFKSAKGDLKLIPVRLDNCLIPPVLLQSLYIDLYGQGLEIAVRQIVDVVSGRNTYTQENQQFSNLRGYVYEENGSTIVECHAEHYMEPVSHFLILIGNQESEIQFVYRSVAMCNEGFYKNLVVNGITVNATYVAVERATVPGFPFITEIKPNQGFAVQLKGVLHEKAKDTWRAIPLVDGHKIS